MAKEPENDLAQLFAAALEDEETRHGRPSKSGAATKGPPTRGGIPKDPHSSTGSGSGASARPARGEATGDTSGARAPVVPSRSVADGAQARSSVPAAPSTLPAKSGATGSRVPVAPSARPAPSNRTSNVVTAPATLTPAPAPGSGRSSTAAPSTVPGMLAPSRSSLAAAAMATTPGVVSPETSRSPTAMPVLSSAAARAATSALPSGRAAPPVSLGSAALPSSPPPAPAASRSPLAAPPASLPPSTSALGGTILPSSRPSPARPPEPEGLTAIPRSEAMTLDRVPVRPSGPASKAEAPASLAPPSGLPGLGTPAASSRPSPRLSLPPPDARPSGPPPGRKQTTAEIRGRPAAELSIETAAEQLDHKGRSKPIFAPRSPRPTAKRLHPVAEFASGLFPGARLMAKDRVASGLAYAIVGAAALLPAVMVLVGWSERSSAVDRLAISRAWIALHFGVLVASALLFELVRCLSVLDPSRRHVQASRVIAALGAPALLVVIGAPFVVGDAPSIVEPTWFAALPLALAAAVAAVDVLSRPEPGGSRRPALVAGAAVLASVLVVALVLIVSLDTRAGLARRASEAGFARLPALLRSMNLGA